jgi:uncharacterized damage-inducible protein DinB
MQGHYRMLAAYNAWANTRLYDAAAGLSDADYRADRGAFFGSVHGTLNHLLVADRIWMHRVTGDGPTHSALDTVLHGAPPDLRADREREDEQIHPRVGGLDAATLAGSFSYTTISKPAPITQPLASALAHFFNHQTHHRGQVHALLTGLGVAAPSLDLILFQRETGIGLSA